MRLIFITIQFLVFIISKLHGAPANSISMKIINLAGRAIELFWIDTYSNPNKLVAQTKKPLRNNTDAKINSYDGHGFSVRLLRNHEEGMEANFTKGPEEEIFTVTFDEEEKKLVIEQRTSYNEAIASLEAATIRCQENNPNNLTSCVSTAIMNKLSSLTNTKSTLVQYRDIIANKMRNYTCEDDTLTTTDAIRSYKFYHMHDSFEIDVLLDFDEAKIWTADDFISEEECKVLRDYAGPNLMKATVADVDGTSVFSEHRKAQQAGYEFKDNARSDALWPLYDRVIKMVNYHAQYNLRPDGQEGLTVIQYNPGDEYTPHCDGTCDGSLHRKHGRIATAVLYCEVPVRGGATTFSRSDIFVKPTAGMATFFSYKGKDGHMDEGLTEHSGCPVLEGEKWIATAWLREGVSNDSPWDLFDPEGVPIVSESDDPDVYESEDGSEVSGDDENDSKQSTSSSSSLHDHDEF